MAAFLSMGAVVINSRALSITEFGIFVLLQTSALLIGGFFSFSTQQPVIKLGLAALKEGDRQRFERIIFMGFIADLLSAAVAAMFAALIVWLLPSLLGLDDRAQSAALIVSGSLLFQGYRTSEGIFRAFDRFDLLGVVQPVIGLLQLGAAMALWLTDAPFIAYAWLAAGIICLPTLAQTLLATVLLIRRGHRPRRHGLMAAREDRREFIAYCWTTSATGTFDSVRMNGDSTAVGILVSVEAAGIYNVAKQLAGILRKASVIYASVMFPELAKIAASRNFQHARHLLKRAVLISGVAAGLAGLGAAIFGPWVLGILFGAQFVEGKYVLVLLVLAAGLQMLSATYSMYVQAFVAPTALLKAYIFSTSIFCAVIGFGLPAMGMVSAGLAQVAFVIVLIIGCRSALLAAGALGDK